MDRGLLQAKQAITKATGSELEWYGTWESARKRISSTVAKHLWLVRPTGDGPAQWTETPPAHPLFAERDRLGRRMSGGKGRLRKRPKNLSIAYALDHLADQPQTVDNEGNPITKAQAAAGWLWDQVFDKSLPNKDRMQALQLIQNTIDPELKSIGRAGAPVEGEDVIDLSDPAVAEAEIDRLLGKLQADTGLRPVAES